MIVTVNHTGSDITHERDLLGISRNASLILNAKTDGRHYWRGQGSLSFKFAVRGEARYKLGNRYLLADSSNFLVLNQAQSYEIFIESKMITETFRVFFGLPLVKDVLVNQLLDTEQMLEATPDLRSPEFLERTHGMTAGFTGHLVALKAMMLSEICPEQISEQLHCFLADLLAVDHSRFGRSEALQSVKKSTRDELLKRLLIVRDYAHAMYHTPVTLEELGRVACLSPNHLLRTFRQLYSVSPIQFINRIRLQKAKHLLTLSSYSIQEVCHRVGYNSLGTFSNTFRKATGLSPSEFRSRKGDFE